MNIVMMMTRQSLACLTVASCVFAVSAFAADCGPLKAGDNYSDVNEIVACLETRMDEVLQSGASSVSINNLMSVRADSEHVENDIAITGQGCKRNKSYYQCRLFVKNVGESDLAYRIEEDWGVLIGKSGDTYRGAYIAFQGRSSNRGVNGTLLPGEGGNAMFSYSKIPLDFEPASLRMSVQNPDNGAYTRGILAIGAAKK